MADYSLRTLLSLRTLTPDAKTMVIALDRAGNRPHTPAELGDALGFPLDHVAKIQRELARNDLSQKFHAMPAEIRLLDGCPWLGVTSRLGSPKIEPQAAPAFSPADQTPLVVGTVVADEDTTKKPKKSAKKDD